MKYLICMISAVLLLGCGEEKADVPKDFDRSGEAMAVTVHVYQDASAMRDARQNHDGFNDPALLGWSMWRASGTGECNIHVVRLKSSRDNKQMITWGHELAHCLYGGFHP